jgi:hypothetical protein
MNHLNRVLRVALMATLLLASFTTAVMGNNIIPPAGLKPFIDRIQLADQVADRSEILIARGHIIRWSDALAGEASISDGSSATITLKIFVIPFTKTGEISAAIIGGVIQSENGARIHEFIDAIDLGSIARGREIPTIIEPKIADDDIGPLIAVHNRRAIFESILRTIGNGGIDDRMRAISIRAAFELRGYACAAPPIGLPTIIRPIWYATTCSGPSH